MYSAAGQSLSTELFAVKDVFRGQETKFSDRLLRKAQDGRDMLTDAMSNAGTGFDATKQQAEQVVSVINAKRANAKAILNDWSSKRDHYETELNDLGTLTTTVSENATSNLDLEITTMAKELSDSAGVLTNT